MVFSRFVLILISFFCLSGFAFGNAVCLNSIVQGDPLPRTMGGTFLGDHWIITPERNKSYYRTQTSYGPAATQYEMGMRTIRLGIPIFETADKNRQQLEHDIRLTVEYKAAGFDYVIPSFFLRRDAGDTMFPDREFGDINEVNVVEEKVFIHVYTYMKEFLKKTKLKILYIQIGNEIDGGFWRDFDSNGKYGGPPKGITKTLKLIRKGKEASIRAYEESGLKRPYIATHLMLDTYQLNQPELSAAITNQDLLRSNQLIKDSTLMLNVRDFVDSKVFDIMAFSIYPNSRNNFNPAEYAKITKLVGDQLNMPWTVAELGVAQEPGVPKAERPPESHYDDPWSWFLDPAQNQILFGAPLNPQMNHKQNLLELQKNVLAFTLKTFEQSENYIGSIYLAPETNIVSTLVGKHAPAQRQHILDWLRTALWVDEDLVDPDGTSSAQMTPAYTEIQNAANRFKSRPFLKVKKKGLP